MKGLLYLLLFLGIIGAVIVLGGCAIAPRAKLTYHGSYGDYTYSSKSGFEAELKNIVTRKIEITSEK